MQNQERELMLEEILNYYGGRADTLDQENIVEMLREIQEIYGCIPPDIQEKAAVAIGVKDSVIACIIKLYKSLKPAAYSHRLIVCTGARCGRKYAKAVEELRTSLGIQKDGLSADKKVFLETQHCLKQCKTAPNIQLDGKLCSGLTTEEIKRLLL